jgi:hypothetical protein
MGLHFYKLFRSRRTAMTYHKIILSLGLAAGLTSINAQATLTVTDGGLGVYDSGANVIFTADANLLGTLEANAISQYGNDNSLITDIISASGGVIHDTPNYYDNGTYTLTSADFGTGGQVDWWAGQAFTTYLNSIAYGGSTQWALPTTPDNFSVSWGFNKSNSPLSELYTTELGLGQGGIFGNNGGGQKDISSFTNVQAYVYLSGTEYAAHPGYAWGFYTGSGVQSYGDKSLQFYAWAVSPGQVTAAVAVPEPGIISLMLVGLLGLTVMRRGHAG